MRILILVVVILLGTMSDAYAQCEGDTCIDVSADQGGNQIVITVKKGKEGISSTSAPKPRVTSTTRKLWIPWLPRPVVTTKPRPRPVVSRRPRVKRISSSQITDQVTRLLPSGRIITQPLGDALVREPVNFMSNTPSQFTTVIVVLTVPITIHLSPLFIWDFGDGNSHITRLQGAPYPLTMITNTYRSAGEKEVSLTIKWSGFWRAGAMSAPINGDITQRATKEITVRPAGTTYIP